MPGRMKSSEGLTRVEGHFQGGTHTAKKVLLTFVWRPWPLSISTLTLGCLRPCVKKASREVKCILLSKRNQSEKVIFCGIPTLTFRKS